MPYLQIRNRFWLIGGDELFVPGLFSVIGRFLWIVIIFFITYLDFYRLTGCTDSLLLLVYLIVSGSVFLLAILCDLSLVCISLRGTMIETYKRRSISYLIAFRGLLVFIQLLCALLGVIGISLSQQIPCRSDPERTDANKAILSIVVVSQLVDVLIQSCCCYLVSTKKVQLYGPDQGDEETQQKLFENNSQRFIHTLQRSCCSPITFNPTQQNESNK
ncbi:hypothetical protein EON65_55415 [archaeon]|nr:MAG: hypothetical protein EON65_55415 [archaeon]